MGLELKPVHDALHRLLEPANVRMFADLAEHPRTVAVAKNTKLDRERTEFYDAAWARCESFLRVAQSAYVARLPEEGRPGVDDLPTDPSLLAPAFRERLRAAMRIPAIEALFPTPWTPAARRMLPSPSPQFTATAMWGPILAWSALELLAESIDIEEPERVALDLFDRLRLREPFAHSFTALGFEGDEGWRVAARIKVVLLTGADVGKADEAPAEHEIPTVAEPAVPEVAVVAEPTVEASPAQPAPETPETPDDEKLALAPALWRDPDVRWLTGVHEAEGHLYLVREQYEELLWWLLMPSLLRLAGEPTPSRDQVKELSKTVEEAMASAEAAKYRIDHLLGAVEAPTENEPQSAAPEDQLDTIEEGTAPSIEPVPDPPK